MGHKQIPMRFLSHQACVYRKMADAVTMLQTICQEEIVESFGYSHQPCVWYHLLQSHSDYSRSTKHQRNLLQVASACAGGT
jgi:hypothetical protein